MKGIFGDASKNAGEADKAKKSEAAVAASADVNKESAKKLENADNNAHIHMAKKRDTSDPDDEEEDAEGDNGES